MLTVGVLSVHTALGGLGYSEVLSFKSMKAVLVDCSRETCVKDVMGVSSVDSKAL